MSCSNGNGGCFVLDEFCVRGYRMRKTLAACGFTLVLVAGAASANVVYTFTANGFAGSDGRPEAGTAVFNFNNSLTQLTITLTNTTVPQAGPQPWGISSVLDGFLFSMSGGSLSLSSVLAPATADCTAGHPPVVPCTFGPGGTDPSFGWGLNGAFALEAGNGSLEPNGIVNGTAQTSDGMGSGPHNPYLSGDVVFTFNLSGLTKAPSVSDVTFEFGTVPDFQPGTCTTPGGCTPPRQAPEPQSLVLLALGMVGLAFVRRQRKAPLNRSF